MADLLGSQAGLGDGIFQRDLRIGSRIAHEAQLLAIDTCLDVDLRHTGHLAAHAQFGELRHGLDARAPLAQRGLHGIEVVADARDNARAGDDYATFGHAAVPWPSPSRRNRPTRRSLAT